MDRIAALRGVAVEAPSTPVHVPPAPSAPLHFHIALPEVGLKARLMNITVEREKDNNPSGFAESTRIVDLPESDPITDEEVEAISRQDQSFRFAALFGRASVMAAGSFMPLRRAVQKWPNSCRTIDAMRPTANTTYHALSNHRTPNRATQASAPSNVVVSVGGASGSRCVPPDTTSFDMRETPDLIGRVRQVSPDTYSEAETGAAFYRAEVELSEIELKKLSKDQIILPGMPVDTFMRTGEYSPLTYLLRPLTRFLNTAMREGS
jgi:hypothetical protein